MAQAPLWSTSSYGQAADTTPMELAELSQHKRQCTAVSSGLVALHCGVLHLHGFIGARRVTTLALLAALVAAAGLLLAL